MSRQDASTPAPGHRRPPDATGAGPDAGAAPPGLRAVIAVSVLLITVPVAILAAVLLWLTPVPWWLGILVGLVVGAAVVWYRLDRADERVLGRIGPTVTGTMGAERLDNLVQGLALGAGVDQPNVLVLDDPAANALAVRWNDRNHVAATAGLVDALEVVELEGVVAELLIRLTNGDAEAATAGAALLGGPMLDGPLSTVLRPVATAGFARLFPEERDLEADRRAVALTRYPPGLLNALRTLGSRSRRPRCTTPGLDHLWLIDPGRSASDATRAAPSRADLDLRIDVLTEL